MKHNGGQDVEHVLSVPLSFHNNGERDVDQNACKCSAT